MSPRQVPGWYAPPVPVRQDDGMNLVEFLRARLDEDEQTAQAAGGRRWTTPQHPMDNLTDEHGAVVVYDEGAPTPDQFAHIARHDPARVLAEVEAKRRILRDYEDAVAAFEDSGPALASYDRLTGAVSSLRGAVESLAAVYADHPDYRDEWAPGCD